MTDKPNSEKIILGTNLMGYGVLRVTGNKAVMETMGVIDLRKYAGPYLKLGRIFERVTGIIESYLPDEMAIEAPFFGKNVQSMLKLGRAQGVAIAAAIHRDIPITEYAPLKIKMAITGNQQRTSGRHADPYAPYPRGRHAAVYGRHGRIGCRLLPFPTDGEAGRGPALPQLERFHPEKSG